MQKTRGTGPALSPLFMSGRRNRIRDHAAQRGYSLAEVLVVVMLVGILALITIPNFTAMYRAGLLKNSLRQFATDLRGARGLAASHGSLVRVSVNEAARPGKYILYESKDNGTTWTRLGNPRYLQQKVYFDNDNFTDTVGGDGQPDIIFRGDGTATAPGGEGKIKVVMDAGDDTTKAFEVQVRTTGRVSTK